MPLYRGRNDKASHPLGRARFLFLDRLKPALRGCARLERVACRWHLLNGSISLKTKFNNTPQA